MLYLAVNDPIELIVMTGLDVLAHLLKCLLVCVFSEFIVILT